MNSTKYRNKFETMKEIIDFIKNLTIYNSSLTIRGFASTDKSILSMKNINFYNFVSFPPQINVISQFPFIFI